MKNYEKINVTGTDRVELHDKIGLTGAEISVRRSTSYLRAKAVLYLTMRKRIFRQTTISALLRQPKGRSPLLRIRH